MKKSTDAWLKAAEDDLRTIEALLTIPELSNVVAFHAQQAVEKNFKAVIEELNISLIKTHNLETLYATVKSHLTFKVDEEIIAELDRLYIDTRCPGDLGLMPHGKPEPEEATQYHNEAKKLKERATKYLIEKRFQNR